MDLRQALIADLYARITGDAALQALIPGGVVRLTNGMPPPDQEFPYLTHRLKLEVDERSWALAEGDWLLDIWDHSPDLDRLFSIRARIITLMDWYSVTPAGAEISVAQLRFVTDDDGVTDSADVHRLMTRWKLYLDRKGEVGAILTR